MHQYWAEQMIILRKPRTRSLRVDKTPPSWSIRNSTLIFTAVENTWFHKTARKNYKLSLYIKYSPPGNNSKRQLKNIDSRNKKHKRLPPILFYLSPASAEMPSSARLPNFTMSSTRILPSPSLERLLMSSWTPSLPNVSFKYIAAAATSSGVTFPS